MYRRGLIAALALAGTLVMVSPAWGYHIPGADYTGTTAQGGSVELDVSPGGSEISHFAATNLRGDTCTVSRVEFNFAPGSGPKIDADHMFVRDSEGVGVAFDGDFDAKRTVHGSVSFNSDSCGSGDIAYTARTDASARGSKECIESRALLRKARRAVRRAKRALRRATTVSARRRATRRLRRARRAFRRAKADVARDC